MVPVNIVANLGETRPTGSRIDFKNIMRCPLFSRDYLNTGTGKAWAGHCNEYVVSNLATYIAPTWAVENLGGTRPIGSEESREMQLASSLLPVKSRSAELEIS